MGCVRNRPHTSHAPGWVLDKESVVSSLRTGAYEQPTVNFIGITSCPTIP